MCFNIVIVNKSRADLSSIYEIVDREMRYNPDGFSMFADGEVIRTLSKDEFLKFQKRFRRAEMVHIHFRKASAGKVNIDNVHMWKVGRYYVSHNGFATVFENEGYTDFSDTRMMVEDDDFRKVVEKERWDRFVPALEKRNFYGVLMLTREDMRYAVFVMTKPLRVYALSPKLVMFCNESISGIGVEIASMLFDPPEKVLDEKIVVFDARKMKVVFEKKVQIRRRITFYSGVASSIPVRDDGYVEVYPNVLVKKSFMTIKGDESNVKNKECENCLFLEDNKCSLNVSLADGAKCEYKAENVQFKDEFDVPSFCVDCPYEDENCEERRKMYSEVDFCQRRFLKEEGGL